MLCLEKKFSSVFVYIYFFRSVKGEGDCLYSLLIIKGTSYNNRFQKVYEVSARFVSVIMDNSN